MDSQQFQHEERRMARFESGLVSEADQGVYTVGQAGRAAARTEVAQAIDVDLYPGNHALMLSSGDHDLPAIVGRSPWGTD